MNTLEAKRKALAKERIETKYKSHKDCNFIEVVTADKLQEFYDFISTHIRYLDISTYHSKYYIISLMKSILFSNIMKAYKICPFRKKHFENTSAYETI